MKYDLQSCFDDFKQIIPIILFQADRAWCDHFSNHVTVRDHNLRSCQLPDSMQKNKTYVEEKPNFFSTLNERTCTLQVNSLE